MDPIGVSAPSPGFYQDTANLKNLRGQEGLEEAAKQFEGIFLQMTLKSMRDASEALVGEDSLFNSKDQKFYSEMADTQMAMELSRQGNLGIADAMIRQLSGQLNNEMKSFENSPTIKEGVMDIQLKSLPLPLNTVNFNGAVKP
jgi:flagellar protein FlgJ